MTQGLMVGGNDAGGDDGDRRTVISASGPADAV
jgi:hypothetical protein